MILSTLNQGHRAFERDFGNAKPQLDSFDEAVAKLEEWGRQCREDHAAHMAEIAEIRAAFGEVIQ